MYTSILESQTKVLMRMSILEWRTKATYNAYEYPGNRTQVLVPMSILGSQYITATNSQGTPHQPNVVGGEIYLSMGEVHKHFKSKWHINGGR